MKVGKVGEGKVYLLNKGGKVWTDIAARFVRSERPVEEIIQSDYDPKIVRNILESGHYAATEFDLLLFGVEGYSRVCEVQLVRKRLASYLIKSGRAELHGKRAFSIAAPDNVLDTKFTVNVKGENVALSGRDLAAISEQWYEAGLEAGLPEEDLRYFKPQATEFKAIIGMNVHALRDWLKIRMCQNAQTEIRDLATKMCHLAKEAYPDLMEGAGPSCKVLGYCPEGRLQNAKCKGKIPLKEDLLEAWRKSKEA
jgi:thymidylate synthase (FAD)